jgi:hypothetical protein
MTQARPAAILAAEFKRSAGPVELKTIQDIERAIDALPPHELAELYAWLDRHRTQNPVKSDATVFEQGLGLFGSPDDAALIDEVVHIAYEERRRPPRPSASP